MGLLPIIFTVLLAANSPFGNLADEQNQERAVFDMHGKTVSDYTDLLQEYRQLDDEYLKAYGAQKTVLAEQVLARAKDVLLAKLGAAETHLKNLIQRLGSLNLLTDSDRQILNSELASYQGFMDDAKADIDAATTIPELRVISLEINRETLESFGIANYYVAKLSITRGLTIIDALMGRADLVQAHITASGALGGNVSGIQVMFDASMLNLEKAKNSYQSIAAALADLTPSGSIAMQAQFDKVRQTNTSVAGSHTDLKKVMADLRGLFGQSPWAIDRSKFLNMEEK